MKEITKRWVCDCNRTLTAYAFPSLDTPGTLQPTCDRVICACGKSWRLDVGKGLDKKPEIKVYIQ
jgi:hypothetical protein